MKKTSLWLGSLFIVIGLSPNAKAQTNDDLLKTYIEDICATEPGGELADVCAAAAAPGPKVGNSGSLSAAATSTNIGYLKRRAAGESDEKQETGGGASADARSGRFSVFANLSYMDGTRDTTALENGFDTTQTALVSGFDYRFNNRLFGGTALCLARTENPLDADAGEVESDNLTLTGFGNYIVRDNVIIDGYMSLSSLSFDSTRRVTFGTINDDANADYDGQQLALGATGSFGRSVNSWLINGVVKIDYINTNTDAYSETGGGGLNMQFEEQNIESLTSKLGVQASYARSQSWGVILPQARFHYVHEFSNDSRTVESTLVLAPQEPALALQTDEPDRDYFIGGIGASVVLPGGMQSFVDLEFISGHAYFSSWTATAGLRWEL